uniref:WRKY domain-containing protein n=1 Tax=Oryza punctata TaxID=4537 RepID=A0A0E0L5Y9_ORYPU
MVELCGGEGEGQIMLASELAQLRAMARELEAKMDPDKVAARELCRALASSVDRSIRLAVSCFPPPEHSHHAAGNAGRDAAFKKRQVMIPGHGGFRVRRSPEQCSDMCSVRCRKGMAKVRRQVRVTSVQDTASLDDGLSWRKYGQKDILGAKYPRAYFRCTHRHTQGCNATKQVQRADGDPLLFDVVYLGDHTCGQAAAAASQSAPPQLLPEHASQEQQSQSSLLAAGTEGIHQQVVEPMAAEAPFLFTSTTATGVDDSYFSFISPANSDCQFSSDFSAGSVGVDMDHEARFEDLFLNTPEFFQSEIQNL